MFTVVIPTYNESQNVFLKNTLELYSQYPDIEVILSHGKNTDDISRLKADHPFIKLITTDTKSRATRINEGIKQSSFNFVFINHPRSTPDSQAIEYLIQNNNDLSWGALTHRFDLQHPLLNFTSWYSNKIRGDKRSIYYLDHCLFGQKQLFLQVGLFPEVDIFEDTEFCLKLKKLQKGVRLPYFSTTSSIRFQKNGVLKQALLNQSLKWAYYLKLSDVTMNKIYEKKLDLNAKYSKTRK